MTREALPEQSGLGSLIGDDKTAAHYPIAAASFCSDLLQSLFLKCAR